MTNSRRRQEATAAAGEEEGASLPSSLSTRSRDAALVSSSVDTSLTFTVDDTVASTSSELQHTGTGISDCLRSSHHGRLSCSSGGSSSLQTTTADPEQELASRTLQPSHDRQRRSTMDKNTESFTINKLRVDSVGLYGREREQQILIGCYERIAATTSAAQHQEAQLSTQDDASSRAVSEATPRKEIILIGGVSGVGKSKLANSLRKPVEIQGGAFVAGKFDRRNEPYSAIAGACREICGKLLAEPEERRAEIRDRMISELEESTGRNDLLALLLSVVPDLQDILGSRYLEGATGWSDSSGYEGPERALDALIQQIHHAFRLFFRILCSHFNSLVVMLDDLQWIDMASIDLMEVLLTDRENQRLLIIGCYRSNEMSETHIFSKSIRDLKEKSKMGGGFGVTELLIDNISIEDANEIIMALLAIDDQVRSLPLAKLCHKRTHGNPLFLIFFLKVLLREEYLKFNFGSFDWQWNLDKIESDTKLTENAVEATMKNMNQIQNDLAQRLQIAAMLGSTFDESTLYLVWRKLHNDENSDFNISQYLEDATDQSFIEPLGATRYRWVHDKIQEAALSLIPEAERPSFQSNVGLILLRNLSREDLDKLSFVVLNLLAAKATLHKELDNETNVAIAELGASAARKARNMSAFRSTTRYATIGIQHLPKKAWDTHYMLTLDLFVTAAEAEGVSANFNDMHALCDQVLLNGKTILHKMPVYYAEARSKGRVGEFTAAIEVCLDAIKQLKVVKIRNAFVQVAALMPNLLSTKKQLASLDPDSLPKMSDHAQIETMKLLDIVASYSFESKNIVLLLDACVKQCQLTLKCGVSPASPSALAQFGGIVFGVLGDLKTATHIADTATRLTIRLNGSASKALVIARTWGFMYGYSQPLHQSLKQFLHGYSEGLKFGDTEMASWCLFNHASASFFLGKPLRSIDKDCQIYIPHVIDLGWKEIAEATSYIWHAALYLMGKIEEDDPGVLLFQDLNREAKFHELTRYPSRSAVYAYLGYHEQGSEYALAIGNEFQEKAPGHWTGQAECFARGVNLYAMARKTKQRRYLKPARNILKTIRGWVKGGSINNKHHLRLFDAEDAALAGKRRTYDAIQAYKEAITMASRSGFLRDAGLISERYADFLLNDIEDPQQARFHVENAIRYYEEWGARRSVDALQSKYADLLIDELPSSLQISSK